ncbi:MAG: hypothetical protein DI626_09670 [Micavibrio aeruginosavorus]|uniref:Protein kinase domain-containing protein n=1 Tax=Micavibrio aeruginosavorus TaxID=349221 RepID=A0A2W5BIH0_9BACT|nr:MAG: hypothetical protein DI626_09670 [Micavibrio aeruginosavorus]
MAETAVQNEPDTKVKASQTENAVPAKTDAGATDVAKSGFSGECAFNDHIVVYSGTNLPKYDRGAVKAFSARGTDKAPSNLFALICEDHLTPRTSRMGSYASIVNPALVRLVASGAIEWAPARRERYCIIYEDGLGNPLIPNDTTAALGLKPEMVLNMIIRPLASALSDLRDRDIVHGSIRGSNIYDGGKAGYERIVLGDCLSSPTSSTQPVLYETIERACAMPVGRGPGILPDDMYALGVTLAVMLRHSNPLEGLSDQEIIERKIEDGSYAAILGKDRFTGSILELLRGLLHDDVGQRWRLDEVLEWLDGRRLSPKQSARRNKAARPIPFNGRKYTQPEILAMDLNRNVNEARQLVDDGEMEQWIVRALEDKPMAARLESAIRSSEEGGKSAGYPERLATRVGIALDPEGPIRYKSISVAPEGVGAALMEAFVMKRDLNVFTEFFMNYFITQWVDAQPTTVQDASNLISKFDGTRAHLRTKGMGGGLEKCLYAMNPEAHCLSEKLSKYHVRTPEDMMYAFEKMSKLPSRPGMFFDRHIVAFLSVKDRKNIDPYTFDLNTSEQYRRTLAEMRTLATIQKRSQMPRFPGIAAWMVDNLEPVYERFHDRELRVELRKKAERAKETGDLAKLVLLFDNPALYQEDLANFRRAMRKHYDLEQEVAQTERDLRDEASFGIGTGRQIAAVVAGILAGIIILTTTFMNLAG